MYFKSLMDYWQRKMYVCARREGAHAKETAKTEVVAAMSCRGFPGTKQTLRDPSWTVLRICSLDFFFSLDANVYVVNTLHIEKVYELHVFFSSGQLTGLIRH